MMKAELTPVKEKIKQGEMMEGNVGEWLPGIVVSSQRKPDARFTRYVFLGKTIRC
jgi:hypothetical protein